MAELWAKLYMEGFHVESARSTTLLQRQLYSTNNLLPKSVAQFQGSVKMID